MKSSASNKNNIMSWMIGIFLMLIIFEILSSLVLVYTYGLNEEKLGAFQGEKSRFSAVTLINIVANNMGLPSSATIYGKKADSVFKINDPVMGYSAAAGHYKHSYLRKRGSQKDWESLINEVTINKDRSRWTGEIDGEGLPKIYVLGDSFVFGSGVNDEQTFSFLLQNALPNYEVKLFALGGYSLTQASLKLESLEESITPADIVILGYADFYDVRHIMSPGWVSAMDKWSKRNDPDKFTVGAPYFLKASLDDRGKIQFSYINRNCSENNGYCEKANPDSSDMTKLTAALFNRIADNTKAKVYAIHLDGKADNPVFGLINDKVTLIPALSKDFDYFIRDDIVGFDAHPGPYWHYAISRKILEALSLSPAKLKG